MLASSQELKLHESMSKVGKQLVIMPQQASANPLMFCGPQADLAVQGLLHFLDACLDPKTF
ncbi:MAG: hypothetical protein AB8V46_05620 [Candidatus Midichloria sp.]